MFNSNVQIMSDLDYQDYCLQRANDSRGIDVPVNIDL
jgi:hypothetical protein